MYSVVGAPIILGLKAWSTIILKAFLVDSAIEMGYNLFHEVASGNSQRDCGACLGEIRLKILKKDRLPPVRIHLMKTH